MSLKNTLKVKVKKINKAYLFRLCPNKKQKVILAKTFGSVRFIYNKMLSDKINHYKTTNKILHTTPAMYKKDYPWLKEVDSLALCNAQLHMEAAYKNFFRDIKVGFPKFKSKKKKNTYTTNYVNGNMELVNGRIKLPKVGYVKIKQHRDLPEGYILKSATLSLLPSGKYYVSILYEYETNIQPVKPNAFIGLDFSMHELYVDSYGNKAHYPSYYRKAEDKLAKEQRKLSHMKKGSNNRNKQRIRVAKLHEKIANQRKDFLHKQSRQITNVYDCVCIENLNMKAMAQALNFGKSVSDNSWGMFTSFLKYKLEEVGKYLIKIDRFYPSSQMCSVCGTVNKITKDLSVREWDCLSCGTHHNRDINAAINIKNEGMRLLYA